MAHGGIYMIANHADGKVYVGSGSDLVRRWTEHRKTLRGKRHKNSYLQAAWNKHGEWAFSWSALARCSRMDQLALEQVALDWCAKEVGWSSMYNLNRSAELSRLGCHVSEETKLKISLALKGRPGNRLGARHSEATMVKLRGRKMSAEARAKMSVSKMGKKRKPFTDETRRRMAEAQKLVATKRRVEDPVGLAMKFEKQSRDRIGKPWPEARRKAYEQRKQA